VLEVSRSCFYEWVAGNTWTGKEDAALAVHVKAVHRRSRGTYGSPRITAELRDQGLPVGRRRVARLMREHRLSGVPKKRFRGSTTDSGHELAVAPNVLDRQFDVDQPNKVWVGDITYLPVTGGWVYLAVLIDLFSRKVVGWGVFLGESFWWLAIVMFVFSLFWNSSLPMFKDSNLKEAMKSSGVTLFPLTL